MSLITFQVACTYSIEAAFRYIEDSPIVRNKHRGFLLKRVGSKRRIYSQRDYDEYKWRYNEDEDEGVSDAFPIEIDEEESEPTMEQLPLLETPNPFTSVWRAEPPTKRRL